MFFTEHVYCQVVALFMMMYRRESFFMQDDLGLEVVRICYGY